VLDCLLASGMPRRLTFTRTLHTLLVAAALAVSLNPLYAQHEAKVLQQSGKVIFLKDTSGYSFAVMDNTVLVPGNTVKTGPDGYAKFVVEDGSTFEVFPNSEVTYRRTNAFDDLLNVWLGKVKVIIQHLPGVPNPNKVTTPTALISVRGTVFDVDVEDDSGTTAVTLDEGVVTVRHLLRGGKVITLQPGGSIRVYPDQPLAALSQGWADRIRFGIQKAEQAVYDAMITHPGGTGAPGGTQIPAGQQGDKGKQTDGSKTGGTGAPTGTGAPPAPPPPPPGGGGG